MNTPVKMGPIGRPETPVRNYRYTLPNIPEDSFERIEEFKYLGTALTNQNSIQEEIKNAENSAECWLSFGAEYVFQFAIQKFRD